MTMSELFGIAGLIFISIAVWQKERRQDMLFVIGGVCLLIYSASIHNIIFMILQAVFIFSALTELIKLKSKK